MEKCSSQKYVLFSQNTFFSHTVDADRDSLCFIIFLLSSLFSFYFFVLTTYLSQSPFFVIRFFNTYSNLNPPPPLLIFHSFLFITLNFKLAYSFPQFTLESPHPYLYIITSLQYFFIVTHLFPAPILPILCQLLYDGREGKKGEHRDINLNIGWKR